METSPAASTGKTCLVWDAGNPHGDQNLAHIALRLVQCGRAGSTPAAVIQWGTTDARVVVTGTLADIAEKTVGIRPPAVIVVGEVVDLHQQNRLKPEVYSIQILTEDFRSLKHQLAKR